MVSILRTTQHTLCSMPCSNVCKPVLCRMCYICVLQSLCLSLAAGVMVLLQEFGEFLERYAQELEQYHTKSEIMKRDQIAAEVGKFTL